MYLDKVTAQLLTDTIINLAENDISVRQGIDINAQVVEMSYDSNNSLIDDIQQLSIYTEYRYIGSNPNNYVWFNCDEGWPHGNSSDNTIHCEKWRIIGIMDSNTTGENEPLVKIIKETSIGNFIYDYKQSSIGSSNHPYGSNDWSDAQLMMMLNPAKYLNQGYRVNNGVLTNTEDIHRRKYQVDTQTGKVYYTKTDGNIQNIMQMTYNENTKEWAGAYYNRANGCKPKLVSVSEQYSCIFGEINSNVDFSMTGIKDLSKNYIKPVYWHLGGSDTDVIDSNTIYMRERGNNLRNGNPSVWYGEIGLMLPSDFVYSISGTEEKTREVCLNYNVLDLKSYKDCYSSSWIPSDTKWTMMHLTYDSPIVFFVGNYVNKYIQVLSTAATYPTLYLKSNILVTGGKGTSEDPYMLMI